MPDGGVGSFFMDIHADYKPYKAAWETFIMKHVMPYVHENFRTDSTRMAIAGASIGGWGALSLGRRYLGLFRSISSYSGPAGFHDSKVSPDAFAVGSLIYIAPLADSVKNRDKVNVPGAIFGSYPTEKLTEMYDPIYNSSVYRERRLFFRCGSGSLLDVFAPVSEERDRLVSKVERLRSPRGYGGYGNGNGGQIVKRIQESPVHATNDMLAAKLISQDIKHDYKLLPDRANGWDLWKECFAEDLPGIMQSLNS
jgi:hypothetical protein